MFFTFRFTYFERQSSRITQTIYHFDAMNLSMWMRGGRADYIPAFAAYVGFVRLEWQLNWRQQQYPFSSIAVSAFAAILLLCLLTRTQKKKPNTIWYFCQTEQQNVLHNADQKGENWLHSSKRWFLIPANPIYICSAHIDRSKAKVEREKEFVRKSFGWYRKPKLELSHQLY